MTAVTIMRRIVDHVRGKSREYRIMVAGSIAIFVIVVFLISWAVFFLRDIRQITQQNSVSKATSTSPATTVPRIIEPTPFDQITASTP